MEGWKPVADELQMDALGWCFVQAPMPYYGGWSWFDIYPNRSVNDEHIREHRGELIAFIDHLLIPILTQLNINASSRRFVLP